MGLASFLITPTADAGILWNEQINGDFSNDRFHPTALSLPPGLSEVAGRIEDGGGGEHIDLDYYSLSIPAGYQLSSMLLITYLSVDRVAFMAIQPGPIFPNDPGQVSPEDLMGYAHFGPPEVGSDLLEVMGRNGRGFTPPLPSGVFTLWVQQTDDFTEYSVEYTVEPIPSPGAGVVVAIGLAVAARRRRAH